MHAMIPNMFVAFSMNRGACAFLAGPVWYRGCDAGWSKLASCHFKVQGDGR